MKIKTKNNRTYNACEWKHKSASWVIFTETTKNKRNPERATFDTNHGEWIGRTPSQSTELAAIAEVLTFDN